MELTKAAVTTSQDGYGGDKEYVVACKNRPFTILVSSNFPTPDVNFIDHKLVAELKLKMSDLQYRKIHFGGHRLRILGKVSTSVQCIRNGMVLGNLHFKASVVENLYENFDSPSVCGNKLSHVLSCPTDPNTLEPQTPPRPAKKKRRNKISFRTPTSNTTSPTSSSGSASSTPSLGSVSPPCGFDLATAAHTKAINAAVEANTKLPPDPRVVQMAITALSDRKRGTPPPPGSSPQYVNRGSHPGHVPQQSPSRRSPPGFPYPRFGTSHNNSTYQGLDQGQVVYKDLYRGEDGLDDYGPDVYFDPKTNMQGQVVYEDLYRGELHDHGQPDGEVGPQTNMQGQVVYEDLCRGELVVYEDLYRGEGHDYNHQVPDYTKQVPNYNQPDDHTSMGQVVYEDLYRGEVHDYNQQVPDYTQQVPDYSQQDGDTSINSDLE